MSVYHTAHAAHVRKKKDKKEKNWWQDSFGASGNE